MPIHQLLRRETTLTARAADFLKRCLAYQQDDRANWNELFDLYLAKDRNSTPLIPVPSAIFDESPTKVGENSGRGRYTSITAPLNVGSAPGPRGNVNLQPKMEKRDSNPNNQPLPINIQQPINKPPPTAPLTHAYGIQPSLFSAPHPQKRSNATGHSNGNPIDNIRLSHQ